MVAILSYWYPGGAYSSPTGCQEETGLRSSLGSALTMRQRRRLRIDRHRGMSLLHRCCGFCGVGEFEDEDLAVGVEPAAGGGMGFAEGGFGEEAGDFGDEAGGGESFFDVVAFEVDIGIDFVSDAVVALVAVEPDVMSGRADPESLAFDGERRFPEAQVIARSDDADGFRVSPAVILRTAEKIKLRHGHGEVGLLREAFEQAFDDGAANVRIDFDPTRGGEGFFHIGLRAEDEEIDHVAGIIELVGDAARDLGEEGIVDAGKGIDLLGDDMRAGSGFVDLDANGVGASGGVVGRLIDADGEAAIDGRKDVLFCADEERLRGVLIADAADDGAAASVVEGKDAKQILEAAREAGGTGVGFGIGVAKGAGGGEDDVFAGVNVDAGIDPGLIAGELEFLREALLGGGSRGGFLGRSPRLRRERKSESRRRDGGRSQKKKQGGERSGSRLREGFGEARGHRGEPSREGFHCIFTVSRCVAETQALRGTRGGFAGGKRDGRNT